VGHIYFVPGSPEVFANFIAVPVGKSNSKTLIETWKNMKTIYGVLLLCIPGNKLALLIKHAF